MSGARTSSQPKCAQKKLLTGRMRIVLVIGIVVVTPVDGDPEARRELQAACAENSQRMLEPKRAREAAVREQPVEADVDSDNAERIHAHSKQDDARPAEEPGDESQRSERMAEDEPCQRILLQFHRVVPVVRLRVSKSCGDSRAACVRVCLAAGPASSPVCVFLNRRLLFEEWDGRRSASAAIGPPPALHSGESQARAAAPVRGTPSTRTATSHQRR